MGTMAELLAEWGDQSEAAFLTDNPRPFLVVYPPEHLSSGGPVDEFDDLSFDEETDDPAQGAVVRNPLQFAVFPLRDGAKSRRISDADKITVGRDDDNDVVLNFPGVSKLHAFFSRRGDDWVIRDVSSKNGTWVGTERVSPETTVLLEDRTPLKFGGLRAMFASPRTVLSVLVGLRKA